MDFYPEGDLIWLEADVLIRQQSQGHRSLDDFCKKFYGGEGGLPKVVPYTFDDVVAVLNEIAPLDWRQFFQTRVYAANPRAPLGGIEGAGWRLVFQETLPDMLKSIEAAHKLTDLSFSLGLTLRACLETTRGAAARDFGCGQEGFRGKGRLASLLLSRRSTRDILLRRASPSGLFPENSAPRSFQTGS